MKKLLLSLLIGVLLLGLIRNFKNKELKGERILEANLVSALAVENKRITSCGEVAFDYADNGSKAPLFEGLGKHTFSISTDSEEAQLYFNQGLNLLYGFNHMEAHRSFKEASKLSEDSPMTYWGQAYALSPNINDYILDDQRKLEAHKALEKAVNAIGNASTLEKSLIMAMRALFVKQGDSIRVDNEAYMKEMKRVAAQHPDNPDVLTLYAAAIMNTMPWDYWRQDMTPRPNTTEASVALNKAISINPEHPGAHHFNIHLTELPLPEEAAKSGDALALLMPGAGHMVHMPSHAYIRVGRYKDAAEANLKAIQADEAYISQCYSQGIYPLGYYPHNIHFLWTAAAVLGDSETALAAAKKTAEKVSLGQLDQSVFMQEFAAVPLQAYVRFGKWNDLLTIPYPGDNLKHLKIYWHFGRGIAFVRKGILYEAQEELDSLKRITLDDTYESLFASINNSAKVADIAYNILAGELLAKQGKIQQAEEHFKLAIAAEDSLTYYEPASWPMPTRHNYGNFLIQQKKFKEAERVYMEDLKIWRNNGWSLIGLYNAYKGMGAEAKASEAMGLFQKAWRYADVNINSSVY